MTLLDYFRCHLRTLAKFYPIFWCSSLLYDKNWQFEHIRAQLFTTQSCFYHQLVNWLIRRKLTRFEQEFGLTTTINYETYKRSERIQSIFQATHSKFKKKTSILPAIFSVADRKITNFMYHKNNGLANWPVKICTVSTIDIISDKSIRYEV